MDQKQKVLENRLRRMANRQGLQLMRSRARDPRDLTYGGYVLVDIETNGIVFGGELSHPNADRGFGASLEDIEEFLTHGPAEPAKAVRKRAKKSAKKGHKS